MADAIATVHVLHLYSTKQVSPAAMLFCKSMGSLTFGS